MANKTFGKCSQGSVKSRDAARRICHSRKKQTANRQQWEAGCRAHAISRFAPRAVLNADVNGTASQLPGFFHKTTVVSFDQPFPIDAPFARELERSADIFYKRRTRKRGRTRGGRPYQDGLDVRADFPDGPRSAFSASDRRVRAAKGSRCRRKHTSR